MSEINLVSVSKELLEGKTPGLPIVIAYKRNGMSFGISILTEQDQKEYARVMVIRNDMGLSDYQANSVAYKICEEFNKKQGTNYSPVAIEFARLDRCRQ